MFYEYVLLSGPSSESQLVPTPALVQLPFRSACEAWLESRRAYISPKTHHEYGLNIKTLSAFFGELRLPEIDGDLVRTYQRMRLGQCGPHSINHECGLLRQIRKRIGLPLDDYQPLPLPKEMRGQVLTDEQRARLFRVAESTPQWEAIYALALICINTTANPKEAFTLRLKDVDLDRRVMTVWCGKNDYRPRPIPLNDEGAKAVSVALGRAKSLGSVEPEHYLFPFRANKGDHYDPTRHQTTFKTAWGKLRKAAQIPPTFRIEDFRHHALTELYQDPTVSDETIEQIAGHHDRRMRKFYSHIRMEYKRKAVEKLMARKSVQRARQTIERDEISTKEELVNQLATLFGKLLKAG